MLTRRAVCLLPLSVLATSCAKSTPTAPSDQDPDPSDILGLQADLRVAAETIDSDGRLQGIEAFATSGVQAEAWPEYDALAAGLANDAPLVLDADFGRLLRPGGIGSQPPVTGRQWKFDAAQFKLRTCEGRDLVAGCINRRGVRNLSLKIQDRRSGAVCFNGHVGGWREGGLLCFVISNTPTRYCVNTCGSSTSLLITTVGDSLVVAGMDVTVAPVMAAVLRPLITVALGI
jgi:hypothetical protein